VHDAIALATASSDSSAAVVANSSRSFAAIVMPVGSCRSPVDV